MEKINLDLKDKKILRELDMDAKLPIKKLAKKVRLSRHNVSYRIKRMKKQGLILGSFTVFDSAVVGQRWFRVVIQLQKITKKQKQDFVEFFTNHNHVFWFAQAGGNWDFILNFIFKDQFSFNEEYERILGLWGKFIKKYEVLVYINVRDQPLKYILEEYEIKKEYFFHEMKFNEKIKLDEVDKKIISQISQNASVSALEIGKKLNLNYGTIQNRIKNLEKNKIILGYRVNPKISLLGYQRYMIFLGIHEYNLKLEKKLSEFLKHKNVTIFVKQLGRWRFCIELDVKSEREYHDFLMNLRLEFGQIINEYETFPIFEEHVTNYFPKGSLE